MPRTELLFYRDDGGGVPVRDWLEELRKRVRRAYAKCAARLRRLAELGYELRRPEADLLREGIYELRARHGRVHYRILYFFHGRNRAILAHALTKEGKVPNTEINRALQRKRAFEQDPERHTYEQELADG